MQHLRPMNRALLVLAALILSTFALGCGPSRTARDLGPRNARSLYPMADGYTWTYDIDTETEMNNLGITRVTNVVGDRVEITTDASETRNYELRVDGIYRTDRDIWLLRDPIAVGTEWPSSGGRTARITSVTETVDVFAGHYEDCVAVREEGGDGAQTIQTVYCQGVGPVIVEVVQNLMLGGATTVRGTLRDFNDGTDDAWIDEE